MIKNTLAVAWMWVESNG